jgi:hypothetical protein
MLKEIFPTKLVIENLSEDDVLTLTTKFAENGDKDWELVLSDHKIITDKVEKWLTGKYEIIEGWVRSGYSSFDIHCDNHYGNQLVCVVQLYGEEEVGGDLVLYDPSWRNPQWVSDTKQQDANTMTVPFKIGQVIIFPSDVWHRVTPYSGKISRITLNLMIKRIS